MLAIRNWDKRRKELLAEINYNPQAAAKYGGAELEEPMIGAEVSRCRSEYLCRSLQMIEISLRWRGGEREDGGEREGWKKCEAMEMTSTSGAKCEDRPEWQNTLNSKLTYLVTGINGSNRRKVGTRWRVKQEHLAKQWCPSTRTSENLMSITTAPNKPITNERIEKRREGSNENHRNDINIGCLNKTCKGDSLSPIDNAWAW